jgi:hypothetical protein
MYHEIRRKKLKYRGPSTSDLTLIIHVDKTFKVQYPVDSEREAIAIFKDFLKHNQELNTAVVN